MLFLFAILRCALMSSAEAPYTSSENPLRTERDLRRDLFQNYDKLVRPVENPLTPIDAQVSVTPLMIRDVDEKHQTLVLETWIMMKWRDEYLTWDPTEYGNITALRLPSSEVWKPDMALYSGSPDTAIFPTSPTQVLVYHYGYVLWVPMFTINSRCPMLKRSEKNYVECNIQIGSWTYGSNLLNPQLAIPEVDLTNFNDINPDWKLLGIKSNRVARHYPCCVEDYPVLHFNATLKRRSSFSSDKNEHMYMGK